MFVNRWIFPILNGKFLIIKIFKEWMYLKLIITVTQSNKPFIYNKNK